MVVGRELNSRKSKMSKDSFMAPGKPINVSTPWEMQQVVLTGCICLANSLNDQGKKYTGKSYKISNPWNTIVAEILSIGGLVIFCI